MLEVKERDMFVEYRGVEASAARVREVHVEKYKFLV